MLLKRISGKLPPHLAVHIPTLEAAELTTTEKILFTSQTVLKARLPSLLPGHIEDLTAHCLAHTGPQVINGDHELEYQEKMLSGASWEGWGISNLDDLVKGWDGIGIVEIAGGKRVAKSLLALHGVLRKLVEDRNAICRWIDTDGGFSALRAKSILDAWGVDDPEVVLERLVVSTCFQIEPDLFDLISVMQSEVQGIESSMGSLRMIVVDSITNLFKDTLMSTTSQGHAAMITVMEELAEMTYAHGLTTWVINGVASSLPSNPSSVFSATTTKPALGTSFTFTTDICLLLQETGRVFGLVDEQERERSRKQAGLRAVVEVLKSRVSPSGIWTVFETDGIQLFDVVAPPLETERNRLLSRGIAVGPARPTFGPLKDTVLP